MEGKITLSDGVVVKTGDDCFDYYSMKRGHFENVEGSFRHDDGTTDLLNGERACSLTYARMMGWLEERVSTDEGHNEEGLIGQEIEDMEGDRSTIAGWNPETGRYTTDRGWTYRPGEFTLTEEEA